MSSLAPRKEAREVAMEKERGKGESRAAAEVSECHISHHLCRVKMGLLMRHQHSAKKVLRDEFSHLLKCLPSLVLIGLAGLSEKI